MWSHLMGGFFERERLQMALIRTYKKFACVLRRSERRRSLKEKQRATEKERRKESSHRYIESGSSRGLSYQNFITIFIFFSSSLSSCAPTLPPLMLLVCRQAASLSLPLFVWLPCYLHLTPPHSLAPPTTRFQSSHHRQPLTATRPRHLNIVIK